MAFALQRIRPVPSFGTGVRYSLGYHPDFKSGAPPTAACPRRLSVWSACSNRAHRRAVVGPLRRVFEPSASRPPRCSLGSAELSGVDAATWPASTCPTEQVPWTGTVSVAPFYHAPPTGQRPGGALGRLGRPRTNSQSDRSVGVNPLRSLRSLRGRPAALTPRSRSEDRWLFGGWEGWERRRTDPERLPPDRSSRRRDTVPAGSDVRYPVGPRASRRRHPHAPTAHPREARDPTRGARGRRRLGPTEHSLLVPDLAALRRSAGPCHRAKRGEPRSG